MPDNNNRSRQIDAKIVNADDMVSMFRDIDRLRNSDFAFCWHRFPTTKGELQAALKGIGADGKDPANIIVNDYDTVIYELNSRLPRITEPAGLDELNYLAVKMDGLTEAQHNIFRSVIEAGRHCESMKDIINITENIDCFDLQPAYSADMYGEFQIEMYRDYFAQAIETLEKSPDPYMREFAAHIVKLDDHLNGESYGRALAKQENGVFTEQGYLTESEGFREVYRGPEDIPAEYRVSAPPERPAGLYKMENADITDFVYKLHALAGDYVNIAPPNIKALALSGASDYCVIMNDAHIRVESADAAYRDGTDINAVFRMFPHDTRAYLLHVDRLEEGRAFGSIVMADTGALSEDIAANTIPLSHVDAEMKIGPAQAFTAEEWRGLEPIDKDGMQSWTFQYSFAEIEKSNIHREAFFGRCAGEAEAIEPAALLGLLNYEYMRRAENPQPGMLRIPLQTAKEMILGSDAPVYRLMPDGPRQLTAKDIVLGGLLSEKCREFAVKESDRAGIDKLCGRELGRITGKRPERQAPDKPKSHGTEL